MQTASTLANKRPLATLLRGEPDALALWTLGPAAGHAAFHLALICLGAGSYGLIMGWWRDPMQGVYVALKLPLILLLTTLLNALLNAMLAPLLGLNLTLRQSLRAVLMSFAIMAAVLGAFCPILAFLTWNAPPMTPDVKSTGTYAFIKLTHVGVIGFAGIVGNARLHQLLLRLGGRPVVAARVLFAWLATNLFVGAQLVWMARPLIGAPQLPVVFFRDTALEGNFYEDVFRTVTGMFIHD